MMLDDKAKRRFWEKVDRSAECWLWTAAKFKQGGYGAFGVGSEVLRAHRVSWSMCFGAIPDGLFVMHRCDTPACVNPSHLTLGTASDNSQDCATKGRNASQTNPERLRRGDQHPMRLHPELLPHGDKHWTRRSPDRVKRGDEHHARLKPEVMARGSQHPNAKLTEEIVRQARVAASSGEGVTAIARRLGVPQPSLHKAIKRITWRHVS